MRGIKSAVEMVKGSGYNAQETAIWCNGYNSALDEVKKFTSANTGSPKLPPFEYVWGIYCKKDSANNNEVDSCKEFYDILKRQLRASA